MVWHSHYQNGYTVDREISKSSQNKKKRNTWIRYILIGLALVVGFWFLRKLITPAVSDKDLILATVEEGPLENNFSARGVVKAASEIVLTAPLSTQVEAVYLEAGTEVKKGEQILKLNDDDSSLEYNRLQDELKLKQNNVSRLELSLKKSIKDIELDNKIKDLQIKSLRASLEDAKRLYQISGATEEEVEQVQQELDIAILEKQKLENELQYRNASFQSDVNNEELQSSIQRNVLNQLGAKISKTKVVAPVDGVLTWVNDDIGAQVAEGGRVAQISNLSSYYIEGTVSDRQKDNLHVGSPVRVRINRDFLMGRVEQILPSITNNQISFIVSLDEPDADVLTNEMNVDLFVVTDEIPDAIYVERGNGYRGGRVQDFFVLEGDELVRRELEIGIATSDRVQILSGARPGEQIVISDMTDYENRKTILLKDLKK